MKSSFDVVFIDVATTAHEAEAIITIVVSSKATTMRCLHVVMLDDHHQLPPVNMSEHPVLNFLGNNKTFEFRKHFKRQLMSLFERLLDGLRCPVSSLCQQYRTHPGIARIQLRLMNKNLIVHPTDLEKYRAP